jgi:lipopolysaccharide/colanic/teichoic acid biosynthesis glycosyltransferase
MEALRERAVRLGGIRARIAPGETESIPDRPWERSFEEWEALEPRRRYARHWRTPFLYAVTLALTPLALLVGLPVALIILLGQRNLDKIFFKQERVGRRGRLFTVLKFRTMRGGADADISDVERVTTFGRLLRNTHLDELPQFINVLRGDMCLIGPRPEMSSIESWAAKRIPGFSERLVLSPGITGWAQITQGYAADGDAEAYSRKLSTNRAYRARLSFRMDLEILIRTVLWMLLRRGWRPEGFFETKIQATSATGQPAP